MRASRWNLVALVAAVVMTVAAAGALIWSVADHRDAHTELRRAEATLTHERAGSTDALARLTKARTALRALRPQIDSLIPATDALASLDSQSLAATKTAIDAGLAGDLAGYNAAVAQLDAINPGHDVALEKLRVQVNALVLALDPLRG